MCLFVPQNITAVKQSENNVLFLVLTNVGAIESDNLTTVHIIPLTALMIPSSLLSD